MENKKTDIKKDISGDITDRKEPIASMEPMIVSDGARHRGELLDLAVVLIAETSSFKASLPQGVPAALANLVRSMNCYYSNLIEGHSTHPIDIERALNNDYSSDPEKRDLQREAAAHIAVQKWIDDGGLKNNPASQENIQEIHRRFCAQLPDDMLWVDDPKTGDRHPLVAGELRTHDVMVGRHIAISPGAVPRFLNRFETAYTNLGEMGQILAIAAAHHRLVWIHPFMDGNGRVARLMTHAMLLDGLDTGGLWSVSRGFARSEAKYKSLLAACDMPRRNDLDGRGTLSEEELTKFTRFFLEICLDQVRFMRELVAPNNLHARILTWAEEEIRAGSLPTKANIVLESVLYRGALPRSDIANILGMTDRHARRITSLLQKAGVLKAANGHAPFHLAFPARLAGRWMPGLFPDQ